MKTFQTNTVNAPQRRKIELNRRQKILLFAFLPFWVILGTVGMAYGFIGDNSNPTETLTTNTAITVNMSINCIDTQNKKSIVQNRSFLITP